MFPIASRHPPSEDQARSSQSRRYNLTASKHSDRPRVEVGFCSTPANASSSLYWSSDDDLITLLKDLATFRMASVSGCGELGGYIGYKSARNESEDIQVAEDLDEEFYRQVCEHR